MFGLKQSLRIGIAAVFLTAAIPQAPVLAAEQAVSKLTGSTSLQKIRGSKGLKALQKHAGLQKAALEQARLMAKNNKMTHTTQVGMSFRSRMAKIGIRSGAAENLAYGNLSHGQLLNMWMNSASHRHNLLDSRFGYYGLASAKSANGRTYWAMVLSR